MELALMAKALLIQKPLKSPSKAQWSAFYGSLAQKNGMKKGKKVLHRQIYEQFIRYYPADYLASKGLALDPNTETNWLKTLFRKHRKSFSYLEHLMVWNVFMPRREVGDILQEVRSLNVAVKLSGIELQPRPDVMDEEDIELRDRQRKAWAELVLRYGIKPARKVKYGGAIYTWLYRHDRSWLLAFNQVHRQAPVKPSESRVNWVCRDWQTVRALFKILYKTETENVKSRMSSRWFMMQLPKSQTLSKYLHKMPLTKAFLERYSETVTEYQLRRVVRYVSEYHQ